MKPQPAVDRLLAWTIDRIGQHADVDNVLKALIEGKLTAVPRPPGTNLDALKSFRKRNKKVRRQLVALAVHARRQAALPGVAETPPSGVAPQTQQIQPVRSDTLAEIGRRASLELKEEAGEVFVTLRSFEQLIGKRRTRAT